MAIGFGDAEIRGLFVKFANARGIEWQDGRAGCIIQRKNRIQFMLAHLADGNGHSWVTPDEVARRACALNARIIACASVADHVVGDFSRNRYSLKNSWHSC